MLCRIEARRENATRIVRLVGRLSETHVPDLLAACGSPKHLIIELDDLASADTLGMDALLRLQQQGARLVNMPEYLRLKLETLIREREKGI